MFGGTILVYHFENLTNFPDLTNPISQDVSKNYDYHLMYKYTYTLLPHASSEDKGQQV